MTLTYELIPPLAGACVSAVLSVYVFIIDPKSKLNRVWSLFSFSLFAYTIGEFFILKSGNDFKNALLWHNFVMFGAGLAGWLFLCFTLIFPDETGFVKGRAGRTALFGLFLIGVLFLANSMYTQLFFDISHEPVDRGYYTVTELSTAVVGPAYLLSILYLFSMIVAGVAVLSWRYLSDRQNRDKISVVLVSSIILFSMLLAMEYVLPAIVASPFVATDFTLVAIGIIVAYSIGKKRLFVIKPATEEKIYESGGILKGGNLYYVLEDDLSNPEKSYRIFETHVKNGISGLVMTSTKPDILRKKYGLEKTPIIYIANEKPPVEKSKTGTEIYLHPSDLFDGVGPVSEFIGSKEKRIIIVDCYEILVRENGTTVERRAQLIRNYLTFVELLMKSDAILLTPSDPRWVNVKDAARVFSVDSVLHADNLWPIILLEQMCNRSLRYLGKGRGHEVSNILERLKARDELFSSFRFENDEIVFEFSFTNRFTYRDAIRYYKVFLDEFRLAAAVDTAEIKEMLSEYGISPYEYDIERGHCYIIRLGTGARALSVYVEFIERGYRGLFISRTHPKNFEKLSGDIRRKSKFLWLSSIDSGDFSVPPKLEYIQKEIEAFLDEEFDTEAPSIIILENLAYLVKYTGSFNEVHLFIAKLRDIVSERNGILLVPVIGDLFTAEEKTVLGQELIELDYSMKE